MGVDFFSEAGIRRYSESLSSPQGEELLSLVLTPRSIALTRNFAMQYGLKKGTLCPFWSMGISGP